MVPLLHSGDFALFKKSSSTSFTTDQVVLVDHPRFGVIIKCLIVNGLKNSENSHQFGLYGLSSASTSTEALGPITQEQILGCLRLIIGKQGLRRYRIGHHN